ENAPVTPVAKNHKITPDERAQGSIDQLKANKEALNDLISTMDRGSQAAEMVRGNIKAWEDQGKKVSPELAAQWVAQAREATKLGKAYDIVGSMLDGLTTAQEAAKDAGDNLGDSFNKIEASSDRYDRKLDAQLAKILELDPALAKDAERMAKLNKVVEDSKAAHRFTEIADAARALAEEMSKLDDHALDPTLNSWDDFRDKMKEIDSDIASARKDGFKPPEGQSVDDVINSLNSSRAKYSDRFVRQME